MRPAHIQASRSRGLLIIDWDDGSRCELSLRGLRAACPCAECRGGHAGMGVPGSPDMLQRPLQAGWSADLSSLQGVGNYAVQPVWGDGHSYGIFSWEYLRQLCPEGELRGGSG
jgi:DUF971 family protein